MQQIPSELLQLCERWAHDLPGPVVLWAEIGLRAAGLSEGDGRPRPYRILGLHNAEPGRLLGMDPPARSFEFEGYADGARVHVESLELALFLERVRDGDVRCIELPYSPLPVISSDLHGLLLEQVRFRLDRDLGALWAKQVATQLRTAKTCDDRFEVLRRSLTGALALRTGELVWPMADLLAALDRPALPDQVDEARLNTELDRAMQLLDGADTVSTLPQSAEYTDFDGFLRFCRDGEQD